MLRAICNLHILIFCYANFKEFIFIQFNRGFKISASKKAGIIEANSYCLLVSGNEV